MSNSTFAVGIVAQRLVAETALHRPTVCRQVRRMMEKQKRGALRTARSGFPEFFKVAANFGRVARDL